MRAWGPPHSHVVHGTFEISKALALAQWRSAAYKNVRQSRLELQVFFEI